MTQLEYASPGARRSERPSGAWVWVVGVAVVLSALSWVVVMQGASDEPYFGGIRKADAIVQVGVGTALIVLWALWCAMVIGFILRRRLRPASSAILIWAAICVFYLGHGVEGYLDDIIRWSTGKVPGASGGGAGGDGWGDDGGDGERGTGR